jgi:hypothetical protein
MDVMGNGTGPEAVGNLRESRKEMAAARRAAKTAAKAPAKKAAPKPAAKKPATDAAPKLRWQFPDGYANRATTGQTATAGDATYAMTPGEGGKWKATVTRGGKTETLGDGVRRGAAYRLCVEANKKEAAK